MAPPDHTFPVSQLENEVHAHTVKLREKNRKLGPNFNLKDCELYELVQYSCTTQEQQWDRSIHNPQAGQRIECFPFVRLFRRCGSGDKMFHVETTAWEGQHAWREKKVQQEKRDTDETNTPKELFAKHSGYFWSQK